MGKTPARWILYLVIQDGNDITSEIISTVLMLTFILHWVLFRLYFTTYVKDQYWSRLITHQWAVKRLLERALEATENIDHTRLGQKCPWPRTFLALEFHYCPFSSASEPPIVPQALECQRLFKDCTIENIPDPTLQHHSRDHISINVIQSFCKWTWGLALNIVEELIKHNIYLASTIYSTSPCPWLGHLSVDEENCEKVNEVE